MTSQPMLTYLKTFRLRSGLTHDDLAFLLGCMDGTAVGLHENGRRIPVLRSILAYELVLGASARELFEGVFAQVRSDVINRARGLCSSLRRKPKSRERDQRIAFLSSLIAAEEARAL